VPSLRALSLQHRAAGVSPCLSLVANEVVSNTWIVNMTDYLDDTRGIAEIPGRARRVADHFGMIVAAMSTMTPEKVVGTRVKCRRRPGRRPCAGRIQAVDVLLILRTLDFARICTHAREISRCGRTRISF